MSSKIDYSRVIVQKLSDKHNTSEFDCGDPDINDFLRNDALIWQEKKLAVTQIFLYDKKIIGFYCSSADSIKLDLEEISECSLNKKRILEMPAIKIGRLGRSVDYRNERVGNFIVEWSIGQIRELSEHTGIRFITVDSYPKRTEWYESFGFKRNLNKRYRKLHNVSMRMSIYNPQK